jgi:signal transduction histidine kinase
MSLKTYLGAHSGSVSLAALLIVTINFMLLVNTRLALNLDDLLYLNFLLIFFCVIYGVWGYNTWRGKYKALREALDAQKEIDANLPQDPGFYAVLLKDMAHAKNAERSSSLQALKGSMDELNDYIVKWVHEIKIPISVCELILERAEDSALANDFQQELEKIKFLTNQVLYISRASSYYEDITIQSFKLSEVVKNSLKRNSTLLISKNIEVVLKNLDFEVLSDEKWIGYVLDQILHNAYKYLGQDGKIEIWAEMDVQHTIRLHIKDDGIGILPGDVSRVFDKSFTGSSKSNSSKSTGMGLYITKKILDKLGHKIEVQSEPKVFTEFSLTFYRISEYPDLPKGPA